MSSRNRIITTLRTQLEPNPNVLALWLEGADATNAVDEYSDLDLCCSVAAGSLAQVADQAEQALASLGPIDFKQKLHDEADSQHLVFHLAGTSTYLLVDLNLFVARGSEFVADDIIERPLVLFDKANVVRYVSQRERLTSLESHQRLQNLKDRVAQVSRLDKYIKRGEFLEAFGYYQKWLIEPLIEGLRMQYTPLHPDYFIVHISRHFPSHVLRRLETLFQVNSVVEIESKQKEALKFFEETMAALTSTHERRA
ncbi:MAG: hypothetical protein U0350_08140 [Caldilineaceae bacterium]